MRKPQRIKPYEVFEHTADVGLRVRGETLEALFRNAALGFFDLLTDVEKIQEREETLFEIEAAYDADLLLKWLRELLYLFSAKHRVFRRFEFPELKAGRLRAAALGEPFDALRHEQKVEIKAVTYHGFFLRREECGWLAEIIFDI